MVPEATSLRDKISKFGKRLFGSQPYFIRSAQLYPIHRTSYPYRSGVSILNGLGAKLMLQAPEYVLGRYFRLVMELDAFSNSESPGQAIWREAPLLGYTRDHLSLLVVRDKIPTHNAAIIGPSRSPGRESRVKPLVL